MPILIDTERFLNPIVFLIMSLVIMMVTYKKRTRYVWLCIVPIIVLVMYQYHVEDVRVMRHQEAYADSQWTQLYQPQMVDLTPTDYSESDEFDEWLLETEGGRYILRFASGEHNGFEVVRTLDEYEPLRGRRNVLSVIELLALPGYLEYDGEHYTLIDGSETLDFTMTNDNRVSEVTDSEGDIIYSNEEEK